jgi:hypothetical protein
VAKKSQVTTQIEITFIDGPIVGRKMNVVYPSPEYIMMGMGRYCYLKKNSTEFCYTEDQELIKLLQKRNALNYDTTKD